MDDNKIIRVYPPLPDEVELQLFKERYGSAAIIRLMTRAEFEALYPQSGSTDHQG